MPYPYPERKDIINLKRIISWPIFFLSLLQFGMLFYYQYVAGQDAVGYVRGYFLPLVYVVSFALLVAVVVEIKNRTIGLLDLVVVFIVLVAAFLMLEQ